MSIGYDASHSGASMQFVHQYAPDHAPLCRGCLSNGLTPLVVTQTGKWLRSVVQGYFNFHAVWGTWGSLWTFPVRMMRLLRTTLRRRSQRSRPNWDRLNLPAGYPRRTFLQSMVAQKPKRECWRELFTFAE